MSIVYEVFPIYRKYRDKGKKHSGFYLSGLSNAEFAGGTYHFCFTFVRSKRLQK